MAERVPCRPACTVLPAICDYITVCLTEHGARAKGPGKESLATAILANLLSPDNGQPHPSGATAPRNRSDLLPGQEEPRGRRAPVARNRACCSRLPMAVPQPRLWESLFTFPAGALHTHL